MDTSLPQVPPDNGMPDFMKGPGEGAYLTTKKGEILLWTHQIGPFHLMPMPQGQVENDLPLKVQRDAEAAILAVDAQIKRRNFSDRQATVARRRG